MEADVASHESYLISSRTPDKRTASPIGEDYWNKPYSSPGVRNTVGIGKPAELTFLKRWDRSFSSLFLMLVAVLREALSRYCSDWFVWIYLFVWTSRLRRSFVDFFPCFGCRTRAQNCSRFLLFGRWYRLYGLRALYCFSLSSFHCKYKHYKINIQVTLFSVMRVLMNLDLFCWQYLSA